MTVTTDTEALVRRAYHLAEGDALDVQGFINLFAEDGVFNGIGGVSGQESYRGEQLGDVVVWMGKLFPDVHRELHRVNVLGDVVAIEVSIRGTFLGPFQTPAGSGKTSLLRAWAGRLGQGRRIAFMSVRPGQHDAHRTRHSPESGDGLSPSQR